MPTVYQKSLSSCVRQKNLLCSFHNQLTRRVKQMDYVITSTQQALEIVLGGFIGLVGSIMLYTILGFVLSIVTMVFIVRKKWAKRKHGFWNFITNFHYLFILVAFMVAGPMLGLSRSVHTMTDDLVGNYLKPTIENQIGAIQKSVTELWADDLQNATRSVKETTTELMDSLRYVADEDEYFVEEKTEMVNWIIDDIGQLAIASTLAAMVNTTMDSDSQDMEVNAEDLVFSITQFENANFSNASKEIASSVDESVSGYVGSFFALQYLNILVSFLFIIAYPLIEMIFYNMFWKKRYPEPVVDLEQEAP